MDDKVAGASWDDNIDDDEDGDDDDDEMIFCDDENSESVKETKDDGSYSEVRRDRLAGFGCSESESEATVKGMLSELREESMLMGTGCVDGPNSPTKDSLEIGV